MNKKTMRMIAGAIGSGKTTFAPFPHKIHVLTVGRVSDSVTRQKTLQPTSTSGYAPLTRPTRQLHQRTTSKKTKQTHPNQKPEKIPDGGLINRQG
jgi:dephospho-CoA kinase